MADLLIWGLRELTAAEREKIEHATGSLMIVGLSA